MPIFNNIFNLNKDVVTSSAVAEEDMIPLKTYLKKFGAYDTPSYGMTEYPDDQLFEGIKTYQRKNNLTVDGTMKREGETIASMNKELSRNKPSRLGFNGKELSWYEDDNKIASWKGMSGKPDYQCKEYDVVTNKGPLPEGKWLVRQSQHQNYDQTQTTIKQKLYNTLGGGEWPWGKYSWGNNRIWLEPAKGTDNKNRTNLSIHGGKEYGSGGCIDLTDKMDEFTNRFKNYGHDMILNVKYDEDCW